MLNKIWCRIFQGVMKLANYFLGYRMPEYIEGPGSIAKLPQFMKEKGAKKTVLHPLRAISFITSPAKMSPATAGTKAVLPGVARRWVSSSAGAGERAGSVE